MGMHIPFVITHDGMVVQPAEDLLVAGSNPCRPTVVDGAATMCARPGFEPQKVYGWLHYHSAVAYCGYNCPPHCLEPSLPQTKTQTVCFCLTGHKYHHCPPPPSMEVQLYLPPSMTFFKAPSREPRRGGSGKGVPTTPPPPRAS